MPREPKKHPRDMTTEEAMEHLFGKRGAAHAKKAAHSGEAKPQVKGKKSIKKEPS